MADIHTNTTLFMSKQPGGDFLVIDQGITTGDVYFVDSNTGSDNLGAGRSPQTPTATLQYAIDNFATLAQGDIIYCMVNHAETATTDVDLFDLDVAGISVIGLGVGSKRPTFTLSHQDATVVISAPHCRLSNVRLIGNAEELVTCLEIDAGGDNSRIDNCYIGDTSSALDMVIAIAVAADADRLIIENNHISINVGGEGEEGINFAGGSDETIIRDNIMVGDWKTGGGIEASGAASANILIVDNVVSNHDGAAGLAYNGHAGTTGGMFANYLHGDKGGTGSVAETTALHLGENYGLDEPALSGIVIGTPTSWT